STRAYQGAAGGTDPGLIAAMETFVLEEVRPDLTLVFDMAPEAGLARAADRTHAETRFESKGAAFHARLRQAFLDIAKAEPERCEVVDATQDMDAVEAAVWRAVGQRLGHG
ncbi:MAG TPA: thymidylate kinase, partial [Phenylobacterium sp.]|nr:thymidylate kinase [Phenylobacterium sp.]